MQNRRSLRNIFNQPKRQIQVVMVFVITWTALVILSLVIFLGTARDNLINFGAGTGVPPEFLTVIENTLRTTIWAVTAYVGLLGILLLVWLFALSHRVFGPTVQIKKIIGDLRSGQYASRGKLRKGDAFHDIMEDLNLLAEDLERKSR